MPRLSLSYAWTPCIPALHLPAVISAFADSQELHGQQLLARCGSPVQHPHDAAGAYTPLQLLQLLHMLNAELRSSDTAFLLGHELLPGHYGAASHALLNAANLQQALQLLVQFHGVLTPLLTPRLVLTPTLAVLYWTPNYGAPAQRNFLIDMQMTAVISMCRWLSEARLQWQCCFNRARPRDTAHHEVHLLGAELQFGCQLDALLIDLHWLQAPWPRGQTAAANAALAANRPASDQQTLSQQSLLAALYDFLMQQVRAAPTLEQAAAEFGVSPATLKRQLARHGTHFQAELDQVRAHVALYLMQARRMNNEDLAEYFGFHDRSSFRRSFKRWTGFTPQLLRNSLPAWR